MRSLRKYLRCVWYLWKHRKEPNNRKKYRRFMRDKRAGGYHAWRLLGELMANSKENGNGR